MFCMWKDIKDVRMREMRRGGGMCEMLAGFIIYIKRSVPDRQLCGGLKYMDIHIHTNRIKLRFGDIVK